MSDVPKEAAPMVTANAGQDESALLRELVGDREEEMRDASSGLSDLESAGEEEVEKEGKCNGTGRPNFVRAATGAGKRVESTQQFFRRANKNRNDLRSDDDDMFATPSSQTMRGALSRTLSAAATSSPQQVGTALTLNFAKNAREGEGMEGEIDVAADDWAEEMANQSEGGMGGVAGADRSTTQTLTPTPARWASATPAPITPTKDNKRMAVSTPRPTRHRTAALPIPVGFAAASALEQILAAIAGLRSHMIEGLSAAVTDANEREERMAAR